MFGELSILNPSIPTVISAIAFTQVQLITIDAEELISQGIRYNPESMGELNKTFYLFNPNDEKISYYFKAKLNWEKDKNKISATLAKENPMMKEKLNKKLHK